MKNIYLFIVILSSHALGMESPQHCIKKVKKVTFSENIQTWNIEKSGYELLFLEEERSREIKEELEHAYMKNYLFKLEAAAREVDPLAADQIYLIATRCMFKSSFQDYSQYRNKVIRPFILAIDPEEYRQNDEAKNCIDALQELISSPQEHPTI